MLEGGVFRGGAEDRTGLGGTELIMAYNLRVRETILEGGEELDKGTLLRWGTGILRLPSCVQTSLIADANTTVVETLHMGTNLLYRTTVMDDSILGDKEMIADI